MSLRARSGLDGVKRDLAIRGVGEHTIEHDHMTVQVEIGRGSKALQADADSRYERAILNRPGWVAWFT